MQKRRRRELGGNPEEASTLTYFQAQITGCQSMFFFTFIMIQSLCIYCKQQVFLPAVT
ncbi:unnamed protein product [Linum tenue]|uniref:Uncharacterized protein n=1 Tax=Linum tenue TaxID=586396 RepID=A0AAV0HTN9_9ROSI|nr:unnamed protein product [Linum tenue]